MYEYLLILLIPRFLRQFDVKRRRGARREVRVEQFPSVDHFEAEFRRAKTSGAI